MQCRDANEDDKALITQYLERGMFKRVGRPSNNNGSRAGNGSGGGGGGRAA